MAYSERKKEKKHIPRYFPHHPVFTTLGETDPQAKSFYACLAEVETEKKTTTTEELYNCLNELLSVLLASSSSSTLTVRNCKLAISNKTRMQRQG